MIAEKQKLKVCYAEEAQKGWLLPIRNQLAWDSAHAPVPEFWDYACFAVLKKAIPIQDMILHQVIARKASVRDRPPRLRYWLETLPSCYIEFCDV
jgi:hypothetical protein